MGVYTPIPYERLNSDEHVYKLRILVAMFITYMDGESFKSLLMSQSDDYLLKLIHQLKHEGVIS